jgi:hypothetical protein
MQINAEALVEVGLCGVPVDRRENQPSDKKDDRAQ